MLLFLLAALFGLAAGLPHPDTTPSPSLVVPQNACKDDGSCAMSSVSPLIETRQQVAYEKRQAYSDDIDSVTVQMHVADSYYAGTDYRIFFAFGDAESTFGGVWSQISTIWEFADKGVQQYNNILKVFDGPSRGDRAEVKLDLKKAFQKDRVSVNDLSSVSIAVLPPHNPSIDTQWSAVLQGGFKIQVTAHHVGLGRDLQNKQFNGLNEWLTPKLQWTPGTGQIVWKGQLELDKWLDQDQKPLSIDEPSSEGGSCPRFIGKAGVIGKRQNDDDNTPPEWDVWGAFEEAKRHLEANTQVGRNRYPHQFNNREALQIPEEFRNRRLQEFPILRGQIYSGQAPGAMRVILAQVGNNWLLAGVMRHPTGRGNAFELCQEWGNAYMAQCWPNGLETLQHLEYPGCDRA
ncbi:hypothetical protein RU639_008528 [Aspergillus parasiticus]